MDNALVGFKKYNGKKSDLLNVTVEPGDIIFGIDSETKLPYIYHNGVFYSDASEWSEALPEIHIGKTMPPEKDPYIKLWLDTNSNPLVLKYKNSVTNDWENVSSNIDITETNEIFIGDNLPADISDNIKVWYQTNVDLPEEDTTVNWDDIKDKPKFADVAFTGNFNDLVNIPDFNLTKKSCTIYTNIEQEDPRAKLSHEQALSNKDAFVKIKASVSNKTELDITVITVSYDGTETSYKNCFITDTRYSDSSLILATIESAIVVQNINKPYISHVKISQFTNGWEYYEEGWDIPAAYASVSKKYLATSTDIDKHTTTYIGTENPSNKYNLWVDTSDEEVVFKYKDSSNTWQILSTGDNGNITVDTELNATSENPIANKAVHELATVIGEDFETINQDISKKANTENGLVEGRGFKVSDTKKYYLPDAFIEGEEGVENTNILATKAEVLSSIDNKATVYNLYAMDDLSAEQLEANSKAVESVQNREVAIYKVYTNDDTYTVADVKLVPGPYLEAYVYVNNPDTNSKQATVTKYTYTFTQAGGYYTSDKQEVVVPSIAKVNELIGSGGESVEVVDNLESESTTAALSANQGRVLKEMIEELPSGGGVSRPVYVVMEGMQYTDEQKAYNVETYNMLKSGAFIILHTNQGMLPFKGFRSDGAYIFSYLDIVVGGGKEQLVYQELLLYSDGTISVDFKSYNITSLKQ